ncbi:hypothetical protein, partial [Alkalihalobacillus sp. TS-13]|uniref:hypothetical protein n=1 Tax=Alkalihalobacillus sp. TS-13 TaxID=2842455 RepID=UPI0021A9F1BB
LADHGLLRGRTAATSPRRGFVSAGVWFDSALLPRPPTVYPRGLPAAADRGHLEFPAVPGLQPPEETGLCGSSVPAKLCRVTLRAAA